jgi:hypothetical protein
MRRARLITGRHSQRLRELEDAGIAAADRQPGRREVWYRLTPAGADLGPGGDTGSAETSSGT